MKLNRNILYIGVIAALVLATIFATQKMHQAKRLYESQKVVASIEKDNYAHNLKVWKDKYDQEHTSVEQYQLEKQVFEDYAKKTANTLQIRASQISNLTQVNTQLSATIKGFKKDTAIVFIPVKDSSGKVIDSIPSTSQINFSWDEGKPWLTVHGTIGEKDSISISGVDSLKLAWYWKRSWLLGPKSYFIDASNSNPYIKVSGIRSVSSSMRDPKWLIAPSIQLGYRNDLLIIPGISLIYYPLSIKIK